MPFVVDDLMFGVRLSSARVMLLSIVFRVTLAIVRDQRRLRNDAFKLSRSMQCALYLTSAFFICLKLLNHGTNVSSIRFINAV